MAAREECADCVAMALYKGLVHWNEELLNPGVPKGFSSIIALPWGSSSITLNFRTGDVYVGKKL